MRTKAFILFIVCVAAVTQGCTYSQYHSLEFPKMKFHTESVSSSPFTRIPSHFEEFSTGRRVIGEEYTGHRNKAITGRAVGEGVAAIYVKLRDDVYFLPNLPEAAVKELCGESRKPETYDPADGLQFQGTAIPKNYLSARVTTYYCPPDSYFEFMDGRLFRAEIKCQPDWLEISNSKEGPFLKFPISANNLISMFGEPTKQLKGTRRVRGCMDVF